jgi:hypothetical protein
VEHAAFYGAALEHAPLWSVELIETSREQRLDRGRNGHVAPSRLADHRDHLLDEQRIALDGLADAFAQTFVEVRQDLDQALRLRSTERLQQDVGGVDLPSGPPCASVEQLRIASAATGSASVSGSCLTTSTTGQ